MVLDISKSFFDPGGYVYGFMGGTLVGPLAINDVFISGMVLCMFFAGIKWKVVLFDKFATAFFTFLFNLCCLFLRGLWRHNAVYKP